MRLSDREIHTEIENGSLVVVGPRKELPFEKYKQVQPCSIDLRLDNIFHGFKEGVKQFDIKDLEHVWDYMETFQVDEGRPIVITPGEILFGQIYEQLRIPPDASGKIVGRSRFARLGLSVHATGDFINPEFEGAMPLQIINHNRLPIVIYPYINICQLILVKLTSTPLVSYPLKSSNPYHRERIAGPSVLHTDPAISSRSTEDVIHAEVERRLIDKYLREVERNKLAQEIRGPNQTPQTSGGTIVISHATIGVLNSGQLIDIVKSTINLIADSPEQNEIKNALSQITHFLEANASKLESKKYAEALELVGELAKQASTPKENRTLAVIRSIAWGLGETVQSVAAGATLWQMYGPMILARLGA